MKNSQITLAAIASLSLLALMPSKAQIIITEVDPFSSGNSTVAADWFELTNEGSSAVNITGWKMDDSSDSFGSAVALKGVTSIAAGQSVVFIEDSSDTDADLTTLFNNTWFGGKSGATLGFYGGSGVGLSTGGDAVNIFNASGVQQAGVDFGANSGPDSFDNSVAKITNDGTISTLSQVGVNGAFEATDGGIGSPDSVGAVPEPTSGVLAALAAVVAGVAIWRRKSVNA